jgi:hypothetical protein
MMLFLLLQLPLNLHKRRKDDAFGWAVHLARAVVHERLGLLLCAVRAAMTEPQ